MAAASRSGGKATMRWPRTRSRRTSVRSATAPPSIMKTMDGAISDNCAIPTRTAGSCSTTVTSHGNTMVCIPKLENHEAMPDRYQGKARVAMATATIFSTPRKAPARGASEVGVTECAERCLKIVLPTSGLPGGATRLGERPEHVQGLRDLTGEGDRIERGELGVERVALSGGEDPRGENPLVRSPWGVVAFVDTAADPALAQEFADGAEEVVVEAKQGVEALQGGPRRAGAVAVIADEAADQQAIALLDPGLVIFAIRAPPRKAHALPLAPAEQSRIDELAAVVTVPGADRKGQAGRHVLDGARDPLVMQIPQPLQFGPGRRDIDGDEGGTVPAGGGFPAVQDEIALQGPGLHPR